MGDRGQVHVIGNTWNEEEEENHVWLYTHWACHSLIENVQTALRRKERWNDCEYLTRMIFSEMIRDSINDSTGFGIRGGENGKHSDVYRIVTVDIPNQKVIVEKGNDYIEEEVRFNGTFDSFIETEITWYKDEAE